MEGSPRTHESDVMQFCIIAIETAAKKMEITPTELVRRLWSDKDLSTAGLSNTMIRFIHKVPNMLLTIL